MKKHFENIMGKKGENVVNQQFLLFRAEISVFDGVSHFICSTLRHKLMTLDVPEEKRILKTLWEKGENAVNQHFLLFPHCFSPYEDKCNVSSNT